MSKSVKFIFWDVQHGNSIYICSPNQRHIVIDLGTGSYGKRGEFSPLKHLKSQYNVQQIDYMIITHPHIDHINDIFNFDEFHPHVLCRPKHLEKNPIIEKAIYDAKEKLKKYFEISELYNAPLASDNPYNPANPANYGGMIIKIFSPNKTSQSNINNHSIVTFFMFAGFKILIPGDNEPPSWNELKEDRNFLDATKNVDVLLAPHHGRKRGFESEIMGHFNPRITIISDGRFCDSSATDSYSKISRGWSVFNKYSEENRKCLTTRNDGVIRVEIEENNTGRSFLNININ